MCTQRHKLDNIAIENPHARHPVEAMACHGTNANIEIRGKSSVGTSRHLTLALCMFQAASASISTYLSTVSRHTGTRHYRTATAIEKLARTASEFTPTRRTAPCELMHQYALLAVHRYVPLAGYVRSELLRLRDPDLYPRLRAHPSSHDDSVGCRRLSWYRPYTVT